MHRLRLPAVLLLGGLVPLFSACDANDPVAPAWVTPTVTLSRQKVPLGTPIEMTYKFVVTNDAKFTQNYHVMVHFGDQDDQLMYTDDHDPPTPTTAWKPGQTVEYTRTFFTPAYPFVGTATVEVGMYAAGEKLRVPMAGSDTGHRSYKIATLQLLPQTEGIQTIYQDGWHPVEGATANGIGWHWTKKDATFAVKNPKKDCTFYLDVDNPSTQLGVPQQVTVMLGGAKIDEFTLTATKGVLRKIQIPAAGWGSAENAELQILVDQTFKPEKDPRELGIRVLHAAIVAS